MKEQDSIRIEEIIKRSYEDAEWILKKVKYFFTDI